MKETYYIQQLPEPIGYLRHKPTHTTISVYRKINRFQRLMMKWCFGLEYEINTYHNVPKSGKIVVHGF